MNSQFLNTASKGSEASTTGEFLTLSLNVMVTDNRGGLTAETTANLDAMSKYIEANPQTTNKQSFNAYREKIATSAAKQYTSTSTRTHNAGIKPV